MHHAEHSTYPDQHQQQQYCHWRAVQKLVLQFEQLYGLRLKYFSIWPSWWWHSIAKPKSTMKHEGSFRTRCEPYLSKMIPTDWAAFYHPLCQSNSSLGPFLWWVGTVLSLKRVISLSTPLNYRSKSKGGIQMSRVGQPSQCYRQLQHLGRHYRQACRFIIIRSCSLRDPMKWCAPFSRLPILLTVSEGELQYC